MALTPRCFMTPEQDGDNDVPAIYGIDEEQTIDAGSTAQYLHSPVRVLHLAIISP